jgi:hypothetical protein
MSLSILEREFDLRYRPPVGTSNYYRYQDIFRTLDPLGMPVRTESYLGYFARRVDSSDPDVRETVTWDGIRRQVDREEPELLPWTVGYTYSFCAEDSYEDFHWQTGEFPADLLGFMVLQVVVTAHFEYDYLRSESHGSIGSLRRIGDRVEPGDNDRPFRIALPGWGEVPAFTKRGLVTSFDGLTSVNGHPCALLRLDVDTSPFETIVHGDPEVRGTLDYDHGHPELSGDMSLAMSSRFRGTLSARLSDGVLEAGAMLEWVFVAGSFATSPVHSIRRISEEEYASATSR